MTKTPQVPANVIPNCRAVTVNSTDRVASLVNGRQSTFPRSKVWRVALASALLLACEDEASPPPSEVEPLTSTTSSSSSTGTGTGVSTAPGTGTTAPTSSGSTGAGSTSTSSPTTTPTNGPPPPDPGLGAGGSGGLPATDDTATDDTATDDTATDDTATDDTATDDTATDDTATDDTATDDTATDDSATDDSATDDTATDDTATDDSAADDSAADDSELLDSGLVLPQLDAGDAGEDAGRSDAGAPDASLPDAGSDVGPDAAIDAGERDAGPEPDVGQEPEPTDISLTCDFGSNGTSVSSPLQFTIAFTNNTNQPFDMSNATISYYFDDAASAANLGLQIYSGPFGTNATPANVTGDVVANPNATTGAGYIGEISVGGSCPEWSPCSIPAQGTTEAMSIALTKTSGTFNTTLHYSFTPLQEDPCEFVVVEIDGEVVFGLPPFTN